MKLILSGTNRGGSRTRQVADLIAKLFQEAGDRAEILDLCEVPLAYGPDQKYGGPHGAPLQTYIDKVNRADGILVVCPEYNGSYPGALKYFIDHWEFPRSFEHRPVAFVGLGGRYGGLRPVEHLSQVFGYRNSYLFPQRVFLFNVWDQLKSGSLNEDSMKLLRDQVRGFGLFVRALQMQKLDANSVHAAQSAKI
jgi:chromate reductase, NAD(P)H dehydrogenase (quinone)